MAQISHSKSLERQDILVKNAGRFKDLLTYIPMTVPEARTPKSSRLEPERKSKVHGVSTWPGNGQFVMNETMPKQGLVELHFNGPSHSQDSHFVNFDTGFLLNFHCPNVINWPSVPYVVYRPCSSHLSMKGPSELEHAPAKVGCNCHSLPAWIHTFLSPVCSRMT